MSSERPAMRLIRSLALAALFSTLPAVAAEPVDTVNTLHEAVLDNMKSGKTPCAPRIETMTQVIDKTFDMPFLAQFVVRKEWKKLSDEQKKHFTAALTLMTASTYATEFTGDGKDRFEVVKSEDVGGKKVIRTRLIIPHNDAVSFDYMLKQTNGQWRIINVIANGVSDIAIRSAQYDRVIKDKGFDALLANIDAQNIKTAKECHVEK